MNPIVKEIERSYIDRKITCPKCGGCLHEDVLMNKKAWRRMWGELYPDKTYKGERSYAIFICSDCYYTWLKKTS